LVCDKKRDCCFFTKKIEEEEEIGEGEKGLIV